MKTTLARLVAGAALAALVLTAIGPSARADVLDDIKAAKKIRVAIDLGLPPYGMTDDKMQPTGSDVDTAKLPQCLAGGHADGSLLQQLYPRMQARAFEPPLAYARQLLKDMRGVEAEIRACGLALPVIEQAIAQHQAYVAQGNEMADPASIVRLYEQKSTSEKTGRMQ